MRKPIESKVDNSLKNAKVQVYTEKKLVYKKVITQVHGLKSSRFTVNPLIL